MRVRSSLRTGFVVIGLVFGATAAKAQLLAPVVHGPISPCNTSVLVEGHLLNSTLAVYVNGVKVGTKTATALSEAVPLSSPLSAGDKVTATQATSGGESPQSPLAVVVQSVPTPPTSVSTSHLFACATSVWVEGAVPGAKLRIQQSGQLGSGATIHGSAWINFDSGKMVAPGQSVTVDQTACGGFSQSTPTVTSDRPPNPLPILAVDRPVMACQPAMTVRGVINGAHVKVFVTPAGSSQVPDGDWNVPLDAFDYYFGRSLKAGDQIAVRQEMPSCVVNDQPIAASNNPMAMRRVTRRTACRCP